MNKTTIIAASIFALGSIGTVAAAIKLAPAPQIVVNANSSADETFTYNETNTSVTQTQTSASIFSTWEENNNTTYNEAPPVVAPTPSVGNAGSAPTGANVQFQMEPGGALVDCNNCTVNSRVNSNGHTVYDVVESNGYTRSVVLWNDGSAEVFTGPKGGSKTRRVGSWTQQGNMAYVTVAGTFAFAL